MLDRIALHQTRLRTPGLALDAKGVALGAKGLVLLASVDRLVGLLAVCSRDRTLADLAPGLEMNVVRGALGTRAITFECAAESSDRMDRLAEAARLVGGVAFTGTTRHFVRYRDPTSPFGYDASEVVATDAALALYDDVSSQTYAIEQPVGLRSLLLQLMPRPDASPKDDAVPRILVAEPGLGPALVHYLVRSNVAGEVCVAEWPPESVLDDAPLRRWILRIPELPERMRPLLRTTPGIRCFVPAGTGVAVEAGYRHPVELRSCPLFDPDGLVLNRGQGDPWQIAKLPPMGELTALARVELRAGGPALAPALAPSGDAPSVRVALQLTASSKPWRRVTATWIRPAELPLLRRLAYALPRATMAGAEIALTDRGAVVRSAAGIDGIPIGTFFVEVQPNLYVPAGHDVTPAVMPEVLARAFRLTPSHVLFVGFDGRPVAIEQTAFGPLEWSLLETPPWDTPVAQTIANALNDEAIELKAGPIGFMPLRGVETRPRGDE